MRKPDLSTYLHQHTIMLYELIAVVGSLHYLKLLLQRLTSQVRPGKLSEVREYMRFHLWKRLGHLTDT